MLKIKTIIRKEWAEVFKKKMVLFTVLFMPLFFTALPLIILFSTRNAGVEDYTSEMPPQFTQLWPQNRFDIKGKKAGNDEWNAKSEKEESLLKSFNKTIYVDGLDNLFMKNLDHPVWTTTANEKCLSCSNCVMVCPTCFCYDIKDEVSMDLKEVSRIRQLGACQDLRFAEVHGGNFRLRRASRLRQFVMHNVNHTGQYKTIKTVGCGRCITWCPTKIDLTEVAKEIQRSTIR